MLVEQPIAISKIFKESWELYRENLPLFLGITFIGHALELVERLLLALSKSAVLTGFLSILSLPGLVIATWAGIALIIAISYRYQGKSIGISDAFRATKGKFWRFIGISLLYVMVFGLGCLLLVIPGFYWGIIFYLAPVIVALEDKTDVGPLRMSQELIRGSFWQIFLITGLVSLFGIVLFLVLGKVGLAITAIGNPLVLLILVALVALGPFVTAIAVILYHHLKERRSAGAITANLAGQRSRKLGCLGVFGLTILFFVLSTVWMSALSKFASTKQGARIWFYLRQQISPAVKFPLTFPGGVVLEQANGWWVTRSPVTELRYVFEREEIQGRQNFFIQSVSLNVLKLSEPALVLDNPEVGKKLFEVLVGASRARLSTRLYGQQTIHVVTLGDRDWGEYALQDTRHASSGRKLTVWKTLYSQSGSSLLVAQYWYDNDNVTEEEAVRNILASLKFPPDSTQMPRKNLGEVQKASVSEAPITEEQPSGTNRVMASSHVEGFNDVMDSIRSVTPQSIQLETMEMREGAIIVSGVLPDEDREGPVSLTGYVSDLKRLPHIGDVEISSLQRITSEPGVGGARTRFSFVIQQTGAVSSEQLLNKIRTATPEIFHLISSTVGNASIEIAAELPDEGGQEMVRVSNYLISLKALEGVAGIDIKTTGRVRGAPGSSASQRLISFTLVVHPQMNQ